MIVPKTALISATIAATPSVSFSAATASGCVTASQKPWSPPARDAQTSAAIGSATITVRNAVTKPRERAVSALSLVCGAMFPPKLRGAVRLARGWASDASARSWT